MLLFASLIALTHFRLLYYLDFCESAIASAEQNIKPQQDTGLATYLSCLPQENLSFAAQLGYQLTREQEKVLILTNQQLAALNVTPTVASISDVQELLNQTAVSSAIVKLQSWVKILTEIENCLAPLSRMVDCSVFKTFAQSADQGLCNDGFSALLWLYAGLVVALLTTGLVAALSLGFNRI